jgi:hypothetical protein
LDDYSFPKWWSKVVRLTPKGKRRGLNSLIILAAWDGSTEIIVFLIMEDHAYLIF